MVLARVPTNSNPDLYCPPKRRGTTENFAPHYLRLYRLPMEALHVHAANSRYHSLPSSLPKWNENRFCITVFGSAIVSEGEDDDEGLLEVRHGCYSGLRLVATTVWSVMDTFKTLEANHGDNYAVVDLIDVCLSAPNGIYLLYSGPRSPWSLSTLTGSQPQVATTDDNCQSSPVQAGDCTGTCRQKFRDCECDLPVPLTISFLRFLDQIQGKVLVPRPSGPKVVPKVVHLSPYFLRYRLVVVVIIFFTDLEGEWPSSSNFAPSITPVKVAWTASPWVLMLPRFTPG
ncbi:hypothetical protein BDN72DRAFT_860300 [Pluteus cervinus]|uniref:Uncharacterized protein n=1 Tax=Pluteus cervinus TaxID=181527 RepID=A0ACD3AJZ5_9AGAR|nr:hypothetical protein BDN72DRAFT_860300 [Pluteus cervinus]